MEPTMKAFRSFDVAHGRESTGWVTLALFEDRMVVGMSTLGCTVDMHLTLGEVEKLTAALVELLGSVAQCPGGKTCGVECHHAQPHTHDEKLCGTVGCHGGHTCEVNK